MRTLAIDDTRDFDVTRLERDYFGGIDALENDGPWDRLYLDHDLGFTDSGEEWNGYCIMVWIEKHPEFAPKEIVCVSSNPVGIRRMEVVADKLGIPFLKD